MSSRVVCVRPDGAVPFVVLFPLSYLPGMFWDAEQVLMQGATSEQQKENMLCLKMSPSILALRANSKLVHIVTFFNTDQHPSAKAWNLVVVGLSSLSSVFLCFFFLFFFSFLKLILATKRICTTQSQFSFFIGGIFPMSCFLIGLQPIKK